MYDCIKPYIFYDLNNNEILDNNYFGDFLYINKKYNNKLIDNTYLHKIIKYRTDSINIDVFNIVEKYLNLKRYIDANKLLDEFFEKNKNSKIKLKYVLAKISLATLSNDYNKLDYYISHIINNIIDIDEFNELLETIVYIIITTVIDKDEYFIKLYLKYINLEHISLDNKTKILVRLSKCEKISNDDCLRIINCFKKLDTNLMNSNLKQMFFILFSKKIYDKKDDHILVNAFMSIFDDFNIKDYKSIENIVSKTKNECPEFVYNLISYLDPYTSAEQINIKRNEVKNNMINLIDIYKKNNVICNINDIGSRFYINNFYYSYHGKSSVDIFKLKSQFFRIICPELNKDFSNPIKSKNEKIKIGFLSDFLTRMHSVFKDRHQIIKKFSEDDKFEVYIITLVNFDDSVAHNFINCKHIKISEKNSESINIIKNLNLDVAVYCEIGMNPYFYFLAHIRFAKLQINTWGHSDTSGIDTIDYYFSSKYYEHKKSQNNYSETLVPLNSLCTMYVNPLNRYNIKEFNNANHFNFSKTYKIYLCPQSLFKLNSIYDEYLNEILEKDRTGIIVLLNFSNNDGKNKIISRLEKKLGNKMSRIHFVHGMQHKEYMNLISIADVMLDPYPFGGCNSSLEAFSLGVPVVTQPSEIINGRFTLGFYKKMGIDDMIAYNKKEYVEIAYKVAHNLKFRESVINKIKERNIYLFEEKESFLTWKEKILELYYK